jgi:hypothetical protein
VVDFSETAGLALHDKEPERISRLLDETIADFSIGIGRPRACGKCRQRGLKPPSKPPERRRPLLRDLVFERCVSGMKSIHRHIGELRKRSLPIISNLLVGSGLFKTKRSSARSHSK